MNTILTIVYKRDNLYLYIPHCLNRHNSEEQFAAVNKTLTDAQMAPLNNANDIYYLCTEGTKFFSFYHGMIFGVATHIGCKMRAVRTMHLTTQAYQHRNNNIFLSA